MKKLRLTAMLLAMLAAMAVTVNAEEPVAEVTEVTETAEETVDVTAEISFPGMLPVVVTSSISQPMVDTSLFLDGISVTGYELQVNEEEEKRTFSLYTAFRVRDYVDLFAAQMNDGDAEDGTTLVSVAVYGTNDEETLGWTQLDVTDPTEESGFYVFDIVGNEEKYAFYRFDFTVEMGDSFTLTEIALFKQDRGEPEYRYDLGDSIEPGEIPELIPVDSEAEEPVQPEKKVPAFSLIPYVQGKINKLVR